MSALRELQMEFADAVVHGGTAPGIRSAPPGRAARLSVYRNNFYANLTGALRSTYPVVEKLVGIDFFEHVARQYILRFPSITGNLHDYGENFNEFLAAYPAAASLPYLGDVARLEWSWHEVFHAPACRPAFNLAALDAIPEERHGELRFEFNRAVRVIASLYPVLRIWEVNQDDYHGDGHVHLDDGACRLLVIQRDRNVEFHELGTGEHAWLQSLAIDRDLQSAFEDAQQTDPGFNLAAALHRHFQLGTLVGWSLDDIDYSTYGQEVLEFGHAIQH